MPNCPTQKALLLLALPLLWQCQLTCVSEAADNLPNAGDLTRQNTQPWALPNYNPSIKGAPGNYTPSAQAPEDTTTIENNVEQPKPPQSKSTIEIQVDNIEVEGSTVLKPSEYALILSEYSGRKLTFSDIQELVAELTELYIRKGFVNSRIYIPEQDLSTNTLKLSVLEVVVDKIVLEKKGRWYVKRAILPRVDATSLGLLNTRNLERSLRIINKTTDLNVQARLEKGDKPGSTKLILTESDQFPVHLTPFIDNLGRKSIGHIRYGVTAENNNLLGFGDQNYTTYHITPHSYGIVNQYLLPVGSKGTQLGFDYAYSRLTPSRTLDLLSTANVYSPSIKQILVDKRDYSVTAGLGLDLKEFHTKLNRSLFRVDRLRIIRPSLSGYINDKWGRTFWKQELGLGLDIWGGTSGAETNVSKAGSGSKFIWFNGNISRFQKMPFGTTGVLRASYQYSPDRLPNSEQFQAGGAYTVRGYREGDVTGDSGYVLNAEWYFPLRFFGENAKVPFSKELLNNSLQFVVFGDLGQVFTKNPVPGESRSPFLISCGSGVRLRLTKSVVLKVDVGVPLSNVGPNSDLKLHFNLQSTLF